MASRSARHLFGSFTYEKPVSEILVQIVAKKASLKNKVADREERIARLRQEYGITDSELMDLLTQAARAANNAVLSYSLSNAPGEDAKVIGAGVVQNIITERNLIQEERETIARLDLIARNLAPITHYAEDGSSYVQKQFRLTEDDLEFLGF